MITARTARRYALWSLFAITLSAASIFLWMRLQTVGSRGPALQFVSPSLSNGWVPFGGDWKSQGKTILNDSEDRGPKMMNGSLKWKNYFIEADIKLLGPYGDAGLIIRSSGEERGVDSYHGYFAGIRNMDNSFIFGRADFGWDQYIVKRIFPGVRGWYHIKLLAYGCSLAASVTNETGLIVRSYVNDPHCIHEGRFGLKSYDTSAEWRNVRIGPSTLNQLQKLTRGMTPAVVNSNLNEVDS